MSAAVDEIVSTAEEEREYRRNGGGNKAVLSALKDLQKQFTSLQNTSTGRRPPRTTGPVTTTKKRVL
ncbi:hypothetical protein D9M71_719940 [compost metagenome]